ncbi:hypothetical protein Ait01nite_055660 [Actinoplanes italicus]|uniref:Uncharacterized protein n=1 Tax=Actinoplanes italicus TaxID=113567 RepID=A0A2T0K7B8_9ACTN|nr:hypothetical protein [Actinoplanes italicus]PRX18902.1 hypothetical protein CLV67_11149 [Actinoplanes italicus]GIE32521.1 hypothetical protein Ait01nite_055660 [Actinoplanes italicus]
MGGYWGTVVVAKPRGLLTDEDAVRGGYGDEKRWLRELGDGWQMVETWGLSDPPDLVAPTTGLVASTGRPALAVYISDGYCGAMYASTPERAGVFAHLWDVDRLCGAFKHQPRYLPDPVARGLDTVHAELVAWAAAAGLPGDGDRIRELLARSSAETPADDLLFALVKALGVARIGRTRPWAVPVRDGVFDTFLQFGPPYAARMIGIDRAWAERDGGEFPAAEPWEIEALTLESEVWASMYRPEVDLVALARRVVDVIVAYRDGPGASRGIERFAEISSDLAEFEAAVAAGTFRPGWHTEEARRYADRRATE